MHPVLKRNFELFPVLNWLAALTAHIPNPGEHVVRYYGWYSNVFRRKRWKARDQWENPSSGALVEVLPPASGRALKQQWARLIKHVYAADPLLRPQCGSSMRIISFIEQPEPLRRSSPQRGVKRPRDGDKNGVAVCDIGGVEQ